MSALGVLIKLATVCMADRAEKSTWGSRQPPPSTVGKEFHVNMFDFTPHSAPARGATRTAPPTRRAAFARSAIAAATVVAAVALPNLPRAHAAAPAAGRTVVVGAKGFSENEIVAYMYIQLLQSAGIPVNSSLKKNLASVPATAALQRGGQSSGIDIFPEYTGTAVNVILKRTDVPHKPDAYYKAAASGYQSKYKLTVLPYSPMNDAQGFATTQAFSKKYGIKSIADMVKNASKVRLIVAAEYLGRPDGLPGVKKVYGNFTPKAIVTLADVGSVRYSALTSGRGDVTEAFTTDGLISADHLVVLSDPKGYALPDNIAPVVRDDVLRAYPKIKSLLDKLAPKITSAAITKLNYEADAQGKDPEALAKGFLQQQGLLKK